MGEKIEDTSKRPPELLLAGALMSSDTSRFIENMEARGQQELAASSELPIEGSDHPAFEKMGIVFGDKTDDIFRKAVLPEGWNIRPTDHSMWSELIDNHGRKRAGIFYKAAFYDRSAHMYPDTYFSIRADDDKHYEVRTADGKVLFTAKSKDYSEGWGEAKNWLKAQYPDNEDVLAYWDTPVGETPVNATQQLWDEGD